MGGVFRVEGLGQGAVGWRLEVEVGTCALVEVWWSCIRLLRLPPISLVCVASLGMPVTSSSFVG